MADRHVRFIKEPFADFVRKLKAEPQTTEYNKRVNFYRMFIRLVKDNPKEFKMEWFCRYIFYYQKSGSDWIKLDSPADGVNDQMMDYALNKE